MSSTDNFSDVYINGYTNATYELRTKEVQDSINDSLAGGSEVLNVPLCHLNFSNIGNIDYGFMNLAPTPLNLKLFDKLDRLSSIIRTSNQSFINLIDEMKCCKIADTYNSTVIPIMEWLIQDFIKVLIQIAEGLIKGSQVFKIMMCTIRPVPGNPWMKEGGYDWLNTIYSYLNGFEAVYDWIMDGNPLDMILNPLEDFVKKMDSCAPS